MSFKQTLLKLAQIVGMGTALGLNLDPDTIKEAGVKIRLPRFDKGDRFYQHLTFKRVKGKWKVRR